MASKYFTVHENTHVFSKQRIVKFKMPVISKIRSTSDANDTVHHIRWEKPQHKNALRLEEHDECQQSLKG